jgi:Domain of unknown function (DUF6484)
MDACSIDGPERDLVSGLTGGYLCAGQLVGITPSGKVLVDYPGNLWGPLEARFVVALEFPQHEGPEPVPVLLFLENQNPQTPIILGMIRDTLRRPRAPEATILTLARPGRDITVDGKAMQFDAAEQIVLRCGSSSLTLRRDGTIVLKGTEIISRASQTNKIKGAMVKIN